MGSHLIWPRSFTYILRCCWNRLFNADVLLLVIFFFFAICLSIDLYIFSSLSSCLTVWYSMTTLSARCVMMRKRTIYLWNVSVPQPLSSQSTTGQRLSEPFYCWWVDAWSYGYNCCVKIITLKEAIILYRLVGSCVWLHKIFKLLLLLTDLIMQNKRWKTAL